MLKVYIITINTGSYSRAIHLSANGRISLMLLAVITFFLLVMSIAALYVLQGDLKTSQENYKTALVELASIEKDNLRLEDSASSPAVSSNTKQASLVKEQDSKLNINPDKHTTIEKEYLLENIPSGFPLNGYIRLSSNFGMRIHPISGKVAAHNGIDIATAPDEQVIAPANGIVSFAGTASGFGKLIKITHNYGFTTYYAHLDEYNVRIGDYVKKGDIIAKAGNTGSSTSVHLHYEVRHLNNPIDPKYFLTWDNDTNYATIFDEVKGVKWTNLLQTMPRSLKEQLLLPREVAYQVN